MKITTRGILEAFINTGLEPTWGTYGNGKETGCGVAAFAVEHTGDLNELHFRLGKDKVVSIIRGYESGTPWARVRVKPEELEDPNFAAAYKAAVLLQDNDKDPERALEQLELEEALNTEELVPA